MKKGFTLIELLAVILILGVITLIVVPTVTIIINQSKEKTFENTVINIVNAVENDCNKLKIKGDNIIQNYVFSEGKAANLNMTGLNNITGTVNVDNSCNSSFINLTNNNYVANKEYNSSDINYDFAKQQNYTKLKFLHSNRVIYIDTGILPNNNTKIEVKFVMESGRNMQGVLGSTDGTNSVNLSVMNGSHVSYYYGTQKPYVSFTSKNINTYTLSNGLLKISGTDNKQLTMKNSDYFYVGYNLYLFARNEEGKVVSSNTPGDGDVIIYYAKIWQNDILVRDFIPVLDNANEPCMYDKVTNTFFYGKGTGSFTYESLDA